MTHGSGRTHGCPAGEANLIISAGRTRPAVKKFKNIARYKIVRYRLTFARRVGSPRMPIDQPRRLRLALARPTELHGSYPSANQRLNELGSLITSMPSGYA
jgi:hypothetical protein